MYGFCRKMTIYGHFSIYLYILGSTYKPKLCYNEQCYKGVCAYDLKRNGYSCRRDDSVKYVMPPLAVVVMSLRKGLYLEANSFKEGPFIWRGFIYVRADWKVSCTEWQQEVTEIVSHVKMEENIPGISIRFTESGYISKSDIESLAIQPVRLDSFKKKAPFIDILSLSH